MSWRRELYIVVYQFSRAHGEEQRGYACWTGVREDEKGEKRWGEEGEREDRQESSETKREILRQ